MTKFPKRLFTLLCSFCGMMLLTASAVQAGNARDLPPRKSAPADATPYLKFIPNQSQWEAPIRYRSDLVGGRLWLRNTGFTFAFQDLARLEEIHETYYHGHGEAPKGDVNDEIVSGHAFTVDFVGANPQPAFVSEGPSEAYYNYFLGQTQSRWQSGLRAWDKVRYQDLYPETDLEVYSKGQNLKYDFIVRPGGDPSEIRLKYTGADAIFLESGDLHIETSVRSLAELRPYAYQVIGGFEVEVPCEFTLLGNVLTFSLPSGYDASVPLVIDPTLVAATYSGSTASCYGHSATYDDSGNIYAAGICFGVGFPTTTGAFQMTFGGATDIAINKYNPDATVQIWSTYIGGVNSDYPHSMIVNNQDELVVFGSSESADYPVTSTAFGQALGGMSDIVVSHLSSNATSMVGSTYLGGSLQDGRNQFPMTFNYGDTYRGEVIVDGSDNIYIASVTTSSNFPTTPGSFQPAAGGGSSDGVVVKLNPTLTTLLWSSYLGGTNGDCANSLKLAANGDVFVTGGTESSINFPITSGAYQTSHQGGSADGYLVRINASGSSVVSGTYLGTSSDDQGYFVEVDATDEPYVLGQTDGSYPVSSGVYSMAGGELFVHKLNGNLSSSQFSTILGGQNSNLSPTAFLVDICGNIYAAAWGSTASLPTTPNAFQPVGGDDFYLITLLPNASGLLYATNFGGTGWEHVDGGTSRFDKLGVVYEASCSNSLNWPVTPGAVFSNSTTFSWDVVCFKFEFNFVGIAAAFASAQNPTGCAPFPVNFINNSSQTANTIYFWDFGTNGATSTLQSPSYTYTQAGTYTVTLIVTDSGSCAGADTATLQVVVTAAPPLVLDQDTAFCYADSIQLTAPVIPGATYLWTPATGLSNPNIPNPLALPPQSTTYLLTLTDSAGCESTGNIDLEVIQINADAGPLVAFCEGEGGTQLQAGGISGGNAPYYYTWWCDSTTSQFCGLDSVYDDDPIANPDTTTWYYLQVQDANGCLSPIDSALVQVLPKPIVDAGPDVGICQPPAPGAVITATVLNSGDAPGPYSVQWMPSAGLNDPTIFSPYARPDTTTIYAAIVTSANGCSSEYTTVDTTSTITVTVHPQPIADAGPEIHSCLGDTVTLQGIGYGAGPDYDYEWSPSTGLSDSTIASPLGSPPFTHQYILNVWSNGCPSTGDTVTFWVHTLPTPSAGPVREVCLGESTDLDAFGAGDSTATYTYQWWPPASLDDATAENPVATPDTTTWYNVVVTSSWGCVSPVDSVLVTVKPTPIADAGPDLQICEGDSVLLQGGYHYTTTDSAEPSQIYYTWWPAQVLNDPTVAQPLAWPDESGWYHLNIQYNTCETEDSVLLTVIPEILPLVNADTSISCEGDSVQLHASGGLGGATFSWIPSAGLDDPSSPEPMAAPGSSTVYTVVMEESGCFSEGQVSLEIIPRPDVAYLNSEETGCAPLTVSFLDDSDDAIYLIWDFGDGSPVSNETAPTHTFDTPGSYAVSLTAVNSGGCAAEAHHALIQVADPVRADFALSPESNPAQVGAPLVMYLPAGGVDFRDLSAGGAVSWRWDFGDGMHSAVQHPGHDYREPGEYMVTLMATNAAGCVSKVTHGPIVVQAPDLFIPNVFSPNNDPVNDVFMVEYKGSQPFTLQVFDRWGNLMHESRNKVLGWSGDDLNGRPVPEGVYYYLVQVGPKEYTGPVTLVR